MFEISTGVLKQLRIEVRVEYCIKELHPQLYRRMRRGYRVLCGVGVRRRYEPPPLETGLIDRGEMS